MNYDQILDDLDNIADVLSNLQSAVEWAKNQGCEPEEMIRTQTSIDPNLLGAFLNLAAILPSR